MPSYVIHLSCAKRALEMLPKMNAQEQNAFFLGNMIADMCRDKHYTHFWNDATYDKLVRRPDLDWFLQKYGDALQEPYVRGYYAHLLLDYNFWICTGTDISGFIMRKSNRRCYTMRLLL